MRLVIIALLLLFAGGCTQPEGSPDPSGPVGPSSKGEFTKGYGAGHDRGYADGRQEGYDEGYEKGFDDGQSQGRSDALDCVRGQTTSASEEAADFCE